jgi:alkylation response protein AidB-like acyl-CoA dehydrogenase
MNQDEINSKFLQIAQETLSLQAQEIDKSARWPEESLRRIQVEGLAGLTVPREFGGLGGGLLSLVQASEVLGRECASAAICFGMHCVASAVISAKATDDHVDRFLSPIVKGRHLTTLSLSEAGTGAHFYIPETKMDSPEHGIFEINGEKSFVTNGGYADSYVVSTVAEEGLTPVGDFSLILVPADSPGFEWQAQWKGFGMRGNSSRNVKLNNVRVPATNLLGRKGDQIWYVFEVVTPYFLMSMAGTYLGVAGAALDEAITHVKERIYSHSGGSLSGSSIIQHRLGVLWSRFESARQLVYHAARLGDVGASDALPAVFSAKAEVGDCVTQIVNEAMTIMGGRGYSENGKLARLLRDARAAHVMAPTTDILRTWTGRALTGAPLLSER